MSTEQRSRPVSWTTAFTLMLAAVCAGLILPLTFPWLQPEGAARARASNYLKQITLAIIIYSDTNRRMPPAAIYSDDGKPLLSWRVLILPWIEEDDLFRQFRLNEPWDSPPQSKALAQDAVHLCSDFACRGSALPHILPRIRWERGCL